MRKLKRALRGEVKLTTAAREALRRSRAAALSRRERASLDRYQPLSLAPAFARLSDTDLLNHFKEKEPIRSFGSYDPCSSAVVSEWRKDPRSGYLWPLDYHRDLKLIRADGSDVRVVWELNRLGHLLRLDNANEFITHLRSWHDQNPYARGPNWSCAMEVALRAMNILVAFEHFRSSPQLDADALQFVLRLLQQHGRYIQNNLEFSYIATSNHYLSDVTGLLWLGVLLPELREGNHWRDFGLAELLREMDKQILGDGADFESSTGYHRFVCELFLYSFALCRERKIEIPKRYWTKLQQMLEYIKAYLRPDGFAPLIGDTDGGQVLPFQPRAADDHAYLLEIGAEVLNEPDLRLPERHSKTFPNAGIYIMRHDDCYLCFNASGAGINGRGSHGHNDALSIEVSARGRAFIVDPGTYVYSANLQMRHAFRSTAYHSTVRIDGEEQNTIDVQTPFVIGNEAKPRVLEWQSTSKYDRVVAEHYGYRRLPSPVTHRRTVTFEKRECSWLIEDDFVGDGSHEFEVYFHFAPGLDLTVSQAEVEARAANAGLAVRLLSHVQQPELVNQHFSPNYGELVDSVSACWRISGRPGKLTWKLYLS
ncbi:MAG TPA: alginate lyase family protein [Pyrinomonadaceae bacterium]